MHSFNFSQADILPITKEWLLARVSEKEIMDFYCGRSYDFGEAFCSPFRKDRHPTCVIFVSKYGKVMYRDWSEGKPLDCYDVARKVLGPLPYGALIRRIAEDMGLVGRKPKAPEILQAEADAIKERAKTQKADIRVRVQPLQRQDRLYLESFHINSTSLLERFRVYSPKYVWLYGEPYYAWSERDPALAYYFGKAKDGSERWKIHWYKRKERRFLGNTSRIAGWVQLPERGNLCVITKSLKDVICLSLFDIPAISMQGEMTLPYPRIIDELRDRFANLLSLYDFDYAGIKAANRLRHLYGIEPLFLTNGRFGSRDFGSKDFSDYLRDHGIDETKALLREAVLHTGIKLLTPYHHEISEVSTGSPFDEHRDP